VKDNEKQLLAEVTARTAALRDAVAVLIALQAQASENAEAFLREVSEQLNNRLSAALAENAELLRPTETIRAEYDHLVFSARAYLDEIEHQRAARPKDK
jgi:ABC-type transporter Mla subunit MlaD